MVVETIIFGLLNTNSCLKNLKCSPLEKTCAMPGAEKNMRYIEIALISSYA